MSFAGANILILNVNSFVLCFFRKMNIVSGVKKLWIFYLFILFIFFEGGGSSQN